MLNLNERGRDHRGMVVRAKTFFPTQESLLTDEVTLGEGPRRMTGVFPFPDQGTGGIAVEVSS